MDQLELQGPGEQIQMDGEDFDDDGQIQKRQYEEIIQIHKKDKKEALDALEKYLKHEVDLKFLTITTSSCNLSEDNTKQIGELVKENQNLLELNLELHYNQQIGDEGGKYLVQELRKNNILKKLELNLGMCFIAGETVNEIVNLINENQSINSLSLFLSENDIEDEQAYSIFEAAINNNFLTVFKIELWGNNISEEMKDKIRNLVNNQQEKEKAQFEFGF